jgi:hypothetical protein
MKIEQKCVDMANAAMNDALRPESPKTRTVAGWRIRTGQNVSRVLNSIKDHVSPDDLVHPDKWRSNCWQYI